MKQISLCLVMLFSLAASAQAQAECPEKSDLAAGVTFTRSEPFYSVVFVSTGEGIIERRIMARGAEPEQVSSVYIHPLAVGERHSDNGNLTIEYSEDPLLLEELPKHGEWHSEVSLYHNGNFVSEGSIAVTFIANSSETIAGCEYLVWEVDDNMSLDGYAPISFKKFYSPRLGVVLRAIKLDSADNPISEVRFDSISTTRKFVTVCIGNFLKFALNRVP